MNKLLIAMTVGLLVGAPVAFAEHGQLSDGVLYNYPFQGLQDTTLGVDWAGVGGTEVCDGCANDSPTPDDCLDADHMPYYDGPAYLKVAYPSVAIQSEIERTQLVPGQSVEAPAELVLACSMVREIVFGQEPDHEYATQPQQVGFGEAVVGVEASVSAAGFFDDSLVGVPSTLTFLYCSAAFAGTESTGTENWASRGLNFGKLLVSGTPSCEDLTGEYLGFLQDNPNEQWDAGTFNRDGTANIYRQTNGGDEDGLYISCATFSVEDANGAAAGFFQDYAYFFVDNADGNVVTDFWTSPLDHSDGGAPGRDCSEVGVSV